MFSKFYQEELTYLRELGRAFGLANPATAGLLAEKGTDPDVERLIEGFAFLAARIRERQEGSGQETVTGLCELLLPHVLRTVPACSVLEFTPLPGALRGRARIGKGAEVASKSIQSTWCRFRTTADVDLLPLALVDAQLLRPSGNTAAIKLSFQTASAAIPSVFSPEGMRVFLAGEHPLASTLLLWFLAHCRDIEVRAEGKPSEHLAPSCIQQWGLEPADALFPWPKLVADDYRLAQEYFTLPAKFLFFDVRGLDAALGAADERFDIIFTFERPPELPSPIARESFRINCVPIINLFEASADPIRVTQFGREHLLRTSDVDPTHMEIFEVRSVTGRRDGERENRSYHSFFDFRHEPEAEAYYRLRRAMSCVDDGLDIFFSLLTAQGVKPPTAEETISLELTCTNRSLASQLRTGDISVATPGSPTIARFRNITPVTTPVRPALGSELHWRLMSHLGIGQRTIADAGTLRSVLELYNVQSIAGQQSGWANQLRINAIRSVVSEPTSRVVQDGTMRGARVIIELDESGFASKGDAYLFGAILDRVLASHATVNSFAELWVRLQPSGTEYRWTPRSGRQAIL